MTISNLSKNNFRSTFKLLVSVILSMAVLMINGFVSNLSGQSSLENNKIETILKVKNEINPYSKSQTNWFSKNGFDTQDYNWNHAGINLHLDIALKKKSAGYAWGLLSAISVVTAISAKSYDSEKKTIWYSIAAGSAIISLSKFGKAKKKILKAQEYRLRYYMQPSSSLSDSIKSDIKIPSPTLSLESPYTAKQTRWMIKNGFDVKEYNWNDPSINLHIDRAFQRKTTGNLALIAGAATALLGYTTNELLKHFHGPDNNFSPTGFYVVGSGLVLSSFTLHRLAKRDLNMAKFPKRKKKI